MKILQVLTSHDTLGNTGSIALIEPFYNLGKPVAAVCHASAVLHRVSTKARRSCGANASPALPTARRRQCN